MKRWLALALALMLLPLSAGGEAILYEPAPQGFDGLEVQFLDIGVGDSIYLSCGGETMLIDGGVADDGKRIKEYLERQGLKGVDYMLNTHWHDDHINGLTRLLELGFTAKTGIAPYAPDKQKQARFVAFYKALRDQGGGYRVALDRGSMTLGKAKLQFFRRTDRTAQRIGNEGSLVIRVQYGERTLLLPADIGGSTQRMLATSHGSALKADIVKSAHHGIAQFVSEWMESVDPQLIVCTGRRSKAGGLIKQMERLKLPVLFAPEGVVRLMTDGKVWHVWQTGHMGATDEEAGAS